MKFAKVYQQTLEDEGIPKDWAESGIQYKALKKCINKVVEELKEVGLERETLQALIQYQNSSASSVNTRKREASPEPSTALALRSSSTPPISNRLASVIASQVRSPSVPRSARSFSTSSSASSATTTTNLSTGTRPYFRSRAEDLVSEHARHQRTRSPVISYKFDGTMKDFTPKIVVAIETESNTPVDVSLSSVTIDQLRKMRLQAEDNDDSCKKPTNSSRISLVESDDSSDTSSSYNLPSYLNSSSAASIMTTDSIAEEMFYNPRVGVSNFDCVSLYASEDEHECLLPHAVSSSFDSGSDFSDSEEEEEDDEERSQPNIRVIEIHLESDSVFFHMLTNELKSLDAFKEQREESLTQEIGTLRDSIATLVDPKTRKSDMYTWREIFKEYMMANVFFATMESDHGEHNIETARRKLVHFAARILGFNNTAQLVQSLNAYLEKNGVAGITAEDLANLDKASTAKIETALDMFFNPSSPALKNVKTDAAPNPSVAAVPGTSKQRIISKLKTTSTTTSMIHQFNKKESYQAFRHFWRINVELLRVLQFQSINKMAISKILKKFDKQTALDSRISFPSLIAQDPFISQSVAKDICFVITEKLLPVTPQIDDFLCPICLSVAYKPIRLRCNHVFCIKCMIHLQRSGEEKCPMCRQHVVMDADDSNLDKEHMQFLKLYFPRESKAKQTEMERQIAEEQYEHLKASGECAIM